MIILINIDHCLIIYDLSALAEYFLDIINQIRLYIDIIGLKLKIFFHFSYRLY